MIAGDFTGLEIARALEVLKADYSSGIPSRLIRAQAQARQKICVTVNEDGAPVALNDLTIELRDLLVAIVERGLEISMSDIEISPDAKQVLEVNPRGRDFSAAIYFDSNSESASLGISISDSRVILRTHSLSAMLRSRESKREAWNHLKELLARLN